MPTKKGIYFSDEHAAFLGDVASKRVAVVVDRYHEILKRERIERRFSEAEWNLLRDVCNGTVFEPAQLVAGSLAAEVEDALQDGVADKWDVTPEALVDKLRSLSYAQEVAAVESIETWWRQQG